MLRVTIELVPFGEEAVKRKLSEVEIGNDGTGSHEVGNYIVRRRGDLQWSPGPRAVPRGSQHLHRLVEEALRHVGSPS